MPNESSPFQALALSLCCHVTELPCMRKLLSLKGYEALMRGKLAMLSKAAVVRSRE